MTHDEDAILKALNVSELTELARAQGLGILSPAIERSRLEHIVSGSEDPTDDDLCPTVQYREALHTFIRRHWSTLKTQLPHCGGECMTFGCPLGVALDHWLENREHVI